MHEQSVRTSNDLYMEFEEKILACNGEIERVVAQCDEANVRITTCNVSVYIVDLWS